MAVRTGYTKGKIAALRDRIEGHRAALRAHLPSDQLEALQLVCGCEMCIAAEDYRRLVSIPPDAFTRSDLGKYFGGAGAVDAPRTPEARAEALTIYLHVLDALAEAVLADREVEGEYRRAAYYVEPSYWLEPLYATGLVGYFEPDLAARIADLLTDLVELGVAQNLPRMRDALVYLSRGTTAFERVVAGFQTGRPRRHLAFWVAMAGWTPNSPAGLKNAGVSDFRRDFSHMVPADVAVLEDALEDEATGRLLERYAFAAQDAEWLGYLSRLVAWRENTILRNRYKRDHPGTE